MEFLMRQSVRSGVYSITNEVNGKFYIGSSADVDQRWASHRHSFRHPPLYNSRLQSAVGKYGIENFTFAMVEECEPIRAVLLEREQHHLDTLKPQYNILPTAGSNLGFKQPPSFYEKRCGLEPWNKGVPLSDEQRAILEAAGFWEMTDEKRKNLSEAHIGQEAWNKGIPLSEEQRRHQSEVHLGQEAWNKGVAMTAEQKQLLSEIATTNFRPDHQALMTERAREVNTGVARSEDTKAKISASNLASEARKAYVESVTGVSRPKEVGEKVSATLQTSEKAKAYHEGRIGKSRGNNPSGHYGCIWDKSRNKWQVRVQGKVHGRFERLEDAIAKVEAIMIDSAHPNSL